MKARPTIFLSGVSHEFSSFRDAVENEVKIKGRFADDTPRGPADDLAAAEELINKCGYHRRDELADAKRAILGSPGRRRSATSPEGSASRRKRPQVVRASAQARAGGLGNTVSTG